MYISSDDRETFCVYHSLSRSQFCTVSRFKLGAKFWELSYVPINVLALVSNLNFQLNTKRYVPKAFLSPFVDGIAMAQTSARRIPYHPIPPHFKPWYIIT